MKGGIQSVAGQAGLVLIGLALRRTSDWLETHQGDDREQLQRVNDSQSM